MCSTMCSGPKDPKFQNQARDKIFFLKCSVFHADSKSVTLIALNPLFTKRRPKNDVTPFYTKLITKGIKWEDKIWNRAA